MCIIYRNFRASLLAHSSAPSAVSLRERLRRSKIAPSPLFLMPFARFERTVAGTRMLQNAKSHNSADIRPRPSLNPVTPVAISSRESNRVSLCEDRYVFPERANERGKDRTFPGLFFRASTSRRWSRLLLIVIWLSPVHLATMRRRGGGAFIPVIARK